MSALSTNEVLVFEGFTVDLRKRLLVGPDGRPIPLSGRAFDTLLYLVEHPNELLEKQTLMRAIWPSVVVEENNLNQNISIVRRALGEIPGEHRFIVTIPGRGFRFVPAVRKLDETAESGPEPRATEGSAGVAAASAPESRPAVELPSSSGHWARRAWTPIFAIAAASLVLVGYLLTRELWSGSVRVQVTQAVNAPSAAPAASVAVMPFANLTGEAAKEYFTDGMAEELINELTKVPGLRVPARTSSFAYKGHNVDVRQIARDLGVATILEGSVRSAGERIRVTAQLVNAQTGYHLWSQTYDRDFGDVFKLEDDIAAEIVQALKTTMNARSLATVERTPPTTDAEAYRLYLQGLAAIYLDTLQARRFFADAIARDPRYARAYAAIAATRVIAAIRNIVEPDALSLGEREANEALAIDPTLNLAHIVLGMISAWRGQWLAAENHFRQAQQLDASAPESHSAYAGYVLGPAGHVQQGLEENRTAFALAPAAWQGVAALGTWYSLMGKDEDAVKYANLAVELGAPKSYSLVEVVHSSTARRSRRYDVAAEHAGPMPPAALATVKQVFAAFAAPADRPAAVRSLKTLLAGSKPGEIPVGWIQWYVLLGNLDEAFDFANRSIGTIATSDRVTATPTAVWSVLWTPEMRPFRRDPRFQALVSRLRLFDFWKQYGPPDECELRGEALVCR